MKKITHLLSVILPAVLVFGAMDAHAQRKNTTSHDVRPAYLSQDSADTLTLQNSGMLQNNEAARACGCKKKEKNCNCKVMNDEHKGKKFGKHRDMKAEITKSYDEAVEKINNSTFTAEQKNLLLKQAAENRDFALNQAKARKKLMKTQMTAAEKAGITKKNLENNKDNRKALKKVKKILMAD